MAPHPRQRPRPHTGFTLPEVMITMALITMLCLSVFAGLQQISRSMMSLALRNEAYHLLQAEAERLLSTDFNGFAAVAESTLTSSLKTSYSPSVDASLSVPAENARGRTTFTRKVVEVASTTTTRTLRVEVRWTWQGRTYVVSTPLYRTQ